MYVLKKQIGIKQNTHFGKIAFNQIDYKNNKSRVLHLAINWSLLVVNFINEKEKPEFFLTKSSYSNMTEKMENLTRANVMSTSTEDNEGWIYQIIRGFRQKGHMDGLAGTKT